MQDASNAQKMSAMIAGYWISQAVHVAAKLGVADVLADGQMSVETLGRKVGAHPPTLYRLMRALASLGVFTEVESHVFAMTPLAETLRSDRPDSQWAMAMMMGDEHYSAWSGLFESVKTGATAFDRLYGQPIFDYLSEHPQQAKIFDAAMTAIHGRETQSTIQAYPMSGIGVLADVGGGNGTNLIGILQHYPEMHGVLFDLPHVVDRASENLRAVGLAERCQRIGGDFFQEIPVHADAYLLRHIIHDWDDEKALVILRNLRKVAGPESRLLLVEYVLPPGDHPSFGKLLDLNMLIMAGGHERTEEQFDHLYAAAGFKLTRVVPTEGDLSVIEGVPIDHA